MVSISFVDNNIIEPFDSKFYIASNKFEKGEDDTNFKTKLELSREKERLYITNNLSITKK